MGTSGILPRVTHSCHPTILQRKKSKSTQMKSRATTGLRSRILALLLLLHLEEERAVDVRQNTTERDRGVNQSVELLVTTDRKLQVSGRDALDFEVLGRVSGQFQHFGRQVFENRGNIDGGFGADAHLVLGLRLEETLHTTAGKLVGEEEMLAG